MKVQIIVPVSAFEPLAVIEKSVECLLRLEKEDFEVGVTYVVDAKKEDERISELKQITEENGEGIELLVRKNNRGRRAGALNDGINSSSGDFFAFFDVDSRPETNFLMECIKALQVDDEAAVASGARCIVNENGTLPGIISVEYALLSYLYALFNNSKGSFIHFNGLIGVIRGEVFAKEGLGFRFNEEKMCEDVDMMDRIYLSGRKAVFAKETKLGEQAPVSFSDLYKQRVRWWTAPLEELSSYICDFIRAKIQLRVKITWLVAMFMPFTLIFFIPFVPLYFFFSLFIHRSSSYRDAKDFLVKLIGLPAHLLLLQICSFAALIKFMKQEKEWEVMKREVI